ncbi:MAG: UxaA family hydrolase [Planctomycetota bacterium]|jgi:altronate hydrolase
MQGYLRPDGRKGIRNLVVVAYLVECAHHVASEIAAPFRGRNVHVIGFPGCYPNRYAARVMERLTTHPNVAAVLLVSLGCESFDRGRLAEAIRASGRPVHTVVIQESGGTTPSIAAGKAWLQKAIQQARQTPRVDVAVDDLVVGTICGGSDATSGLSANPAVGRALDRLVEVGATAVFEETGELIGCEQFLATRAATRDLADALLASVAKAARYYATLGHESFAPGNSEGGLTTIEEKSAGAYSKSGTATISGLLKPGDQPPRGGLYLLDVVPDGEVRFGFPNIADNAEIVELISCGAHLILFTTGRGSVVGSAVSPVIKVCANSETFRKMPDDMDVDAGRILEGRGSLDDVGREIYDRVLAVADGALTCSERLGHREFLLTYKSFESGRTNCQAAG